jgi:transglutaminase superfamily protein
MTRRARRLGAVRRGLLASEIVMTYVNVRRLLRRHTLPETVEALRAGGPAARRNDEATLALGRHLAWATVRTITILPFDSRCLMRSLVLTRLLSRRGLGSTFVLSAAPGRQLQAHAWVEHSGEPLLEPAGADHEHLVRL